MDVHATVVRHRNGLVRVDRDNDAIAKSGEGFVDGVVDSLENHVVKTRAVIGVTDVHSRAFTDRVEAL
jgi:hypothetical protein